MKNRNIDNQQQDKMSRTDQTSGAASQNTSTDDRDQQIKNESDTARLRSERQSVIDGQKNDQQSEE